MHRLPWMTHLIRLALPALFLAGCVWIPAPIPPSGTLESSAAPFSLAQTPITLPDSRQITALLPSQPPASTASSPASLAGSDPSTPPPVQPAQDRHRQQYRLSAALDYTQHRLEVEQIIDYTNNTPDPLLAIALVVEPLRYPGAFQLERLATEAGPAIAQQVQEGAQLTLLLERPLPPSQSLRLSLSYALQLPDTSQDATDQPRPFGYTALQANLGDWYPFIPPFTPGQGWLVHSPADYGEHLVYESADFDVRLRLVGSLQEVVVAASAPALLEGEELHYIHPAARSFAFSASPFYQVATQDVQVPGGQKVTVLSYYLPLYQDAGQRVLHTTAEALALYSELFGPYERPTLSAVQADFVDGMEYDGLYFLSKDYYNWYAGTTAEYLVAVAAHETCHQWWYGLVGNDQAMQPWLDEALCTYCERLYYENRHPDSLDWWWSYRVDFYQPRGQIDISIYDAPQEYGSFRDYRDIVYLRGALFMEELRQLLGDTAFLAFLRDYAGRNTHALATAQDFFSTLADQTSVDLGPLVQEFFASDPRE